MPESKKVLLVDLDDPRRETRVKMLESVGYAVEVRKDHEAAELLHHEACFDLVLLALHEKKLREAAAYSDRLAKRHPSLPILLLSDAGVFAPLGTLSRTVETNLPVEMLEEIAEMLAGSKHIREIAADATFAAD
jgi:hypothetical protein